MNNSKTLVALVVIAVIAIMGIFFPKVKETVKEVTVGRVDNYFQTNFQSGISGTKAGFVSTTTIACAIQNPLTSTSTFSHVAFSTLQATTTTTVIGISTSTNANRFSTSTALTSKTIASGAVGSASYEPTSNNNIIGPGGWILFGYGAGTTLPTVAQRQVGQCSALFTEI